MHGESATKRVLSDEQMCICVDADREGLVVARCVNRAKPTSENVQEALGARIGENVVFLCDGATAYNKLIEAKKCRKLVLNTHEDYNKAYHLNTVNGLHSRLKAMLRRFLGISSKYLNRYLALFTAPEQAGRSAFYPETDSVRQIIARVNAVRRVRNMSKEAVLAF